MWEKELIEQTLIILRNFEMEMWQLDCIQASESFKPAIETLEKQLEMLKYFEGVNNNG